MNLAHNAVQHTEPDDTIAIGVVRQRRLVRIRVRDTGAGISVSDQAIDLRPLHPRHGRSPPLPRAAGSGSPS